ncbi:LON peptidase substrate-binding domain-containing protein [Nocardioides pocheonensis]|uniref:Peptidase S16 n=1 Tax=Nocardioides pocheonensis TaxID=661485 RepID=A0A3N0GU29_9ACTN|nr:LON peptidase substrate-binding domain-containing protein [Nocardioides pocheonensis]RNM15977.1 peptidase S16 [Nocardioides pocheonensis]
MTTVPVFPLNSVLFPGVVAPLHIFEDRYRALMRDLLLLPEPADRIFAVVAIREGYEVGDRGVQSLHRVGTVVQVTDVERYDDGRFDIEVTGRQRIVLDEVDPAGEYLTARGDLVEDEDDVEEAADEAVLALNAFEEYRTALSALRGGPVLAGPMPRHPAYLSYTLAATCLLSQGQRQDLLEAPDALTRLRMLRRSLHEEMQAMRALPSLPATEVARTRWSPN